jgi:type II secretory pathway component PulC
MANKDYREHLLIGANLSLLLLIILTLTFNIQAWRQDWQLTHKVVSPLTMTALNQDKALIDQLPDLHVFGKPMQAVSDVPVSNLELHVTGIAKSTAKDKTGISSAYISISNQPSKIFHVGDVVYAGVKLYDISDDAVVLQNNGKLEKLPLKRTKLEFKPRPSKETN